MASFVRLVERHRVAAVLLFLLVFPLLMPYEALAVNILVFGLYAVGFNLLFGYTGLLSFGHAAFFGVGSYLTGIAIVHAGLPWPVAIAAGVAASLVVGAAVGFLAIRSRGIYFSMVTLALAQIVYYGFYKAERWTGGENGLRGVRVDPIEFAGLRLDFTNPTTKYYVILVFVAAALWLVSRILASPFGAVMEAIRENDRRAAACGYDVPRSKLLVFVLSAGLCGLAGSLRAIHLSVVPIDSLHYLTSGHAVMMCLLGGMGTFFGPFVGAGVFLYLEDVVTTLTQHWMLVVGIVFMAFVLFFPRGIWGTVLHVLHRRTQRSEAAAARGVGAPVEAAPAGEVRP
ncbi:branched-chain amino acid ABC transporter permease [Ramlibacter sp. AN1133]|uniref:branched-chain amino acid ABC transporter permease n=1 Tax=Ramlibacter sp. AN1133 TaxID=3133429 RepID=UPI0030C350BB